MTPHELVGLGKFWAEYGVAAVVIVLLAFAGIVFFIYYLHGTFKRICAATALIEKIAASHLDAEGKPIKHHKFHASLRDIAVEIKALLETHDDSAQKHYGDVERLSSDEHWMHCNVDKCPNLGNLLMQFSTMLAKFEVFEVAATADRKRTYEGLDTLAAELQALGREIIATLRAVRTNGNSKGEDDAK